MRKFCHSISFFIVIGLACLSLQGCAPAVLVGAGVAGATVAASSMSVKTQVDDVKIKTDIMRLLEDMPSLHDHSNIGITVFNRVVLLIGQVPTKALSQELSGQISRVAGVKLVYNELSIGPNISMSQYLDDSWITAKVKANMMRHVNPFAFKVVTENAVVYLMAITTIEDGKLAADLASRTAGVKKVVTLYDYATGKIESQQRPDLSSHQPQVSAVNEAAL